MYTFVAFAMSGTSQAVHEIESVKNFFKTRHSSANNDTLQASFADSLIMMIKNIKDFGPADAAHINTAMTDTPYGTEQTSRISASIDALLTQSGKRSDAQSASRSAADKQSLKHWWCYMTARDMTVIRDPRQSMHRKLCVLAERGMKLGMVDPDEQSFKWLLAMLLLCHYDELPDAQHIYDKLHDLKRTWSAEKRSISVEKLSTYPETPSLMPPSLFNDAYETDDPPIIVHMPGVTRIAECVPLRNNSKLLKAKQQQQHHQRNSCTEAFEATKQHIAGTHHAGGSAGAPSAGAHGGVTPVKQEQEEPIDDEEVIRLEYELKCARLRAAKGLLASMTRPVSSAVPSPSSSRPSPSSSPTAHGTLKLQRDGGGVYRLQHSAVKAEPKDEVDDTGVVQPAMSACKSEDQQHISIADLDPYAQSAIAALASRTASKHGKKAGAAAAPTSTPTTKGRGMKRPAAAAAVDYIPEKKK